MYMILLHLLWWREKRSDTFIFVPGYIKYSRCNDILCVKFKRGKVLVRFHIEFFQRYKVNYVFFQRKYLRFQGFQVKYLRFKRKYVRI